MESVERIMHTFEGKPVDRVPTFSAGMEDRTFCDVLGQPFFSQKFLKNFPFTRLMTKKFPGAAMKYLFQPMLEKNFIKRIKAAYLLGFDATWALFDVSFRIAGPNLLARDMGGIFNLIDDGFNNLGYQYNGPGIKSREDFEAWPHWPDPDAVAQRSYKFFKLMVRQYGEKISLFGQASAYGLHESMLWAFGLQQMMVWFRKERDLVRRFIDLGEELCLKTAMAMMDAGVKIIMQPDDFCFKSGPFLNPKMIQELFGPSYQRIIKAIHDRKGKFVLHSCGDNTLLFDTFIKWGVDGLHAYENTSNVDIYKEKKNRGHQVVMLGGVGIDYLLTERSKDEEIIEEVKHLVAGLGPGGRYILSPSHSMSTIPADKLKVMVNAVNRYGNYGHLGQEINE